MIRSLADRIFQPRARLRHGEDAVLPDGRQPLHALDRVERVRAEGVDGGEPLRRRPEDRRLLRPPVVGVP